MKVDLKSQDITVSFFSNEKTKGWINKPKSGVRIIHIPTGVVVVCDTAKSQHKNRAIAMCMLMEKIITMSNLDVLAEQQKQAQTIMEEFFDKLGNLAINEDAMGALISEKLQCQHKTKQQTFWRIMQATIGHYGRYSNIDLRNQASREWCNEISKIKTVIPYI